MKMLDWLKPKPPRTKPPLKADTADDVEKAVVKQRLSEIQSRLKALGAEADVLAGRLNEETQKL